MKARRILAGIAASLLVLACWQYVGGDPVQNETGNPQPTNTKEN